MNRSLLWLLVTAVLIVLICWGYYVQSPKRDEFEYITEKTEYTNSFGESFWIIKSTFINLSPSRPGYERLNIYSEDTGYIFADKKSYNEVRCVFRLGEINKQIPVYVIIYKNGSEFISWKNAGTYFIEYTDRRVNAKYIKEQYMGYSNFDLVCSFLINNRNDICESFFYEKVRSDAIIGFISEISELQE